MLSMTGYGRARVQKDGREMTVELKSVNHRFLDLSYRLPRNLGFLDEAVRSRISSRLSRGHIDIFITYANHREDARQLRVDLPLAQSLKTAAADLSARLGLSEQASLSDFLRYPDILIMEEKDEDQEAVKALFEETVNMALDELIAMRQSEGGNLQRDVLAKADRLSEIRGAIEKRAPEVVKGYREKLSARLADLLGGQMDESRFLTEVAIFADRAAIDEELVRLVSHLEQIRKAAGQNEPSGRKLDFLVQELNREFNTIGSKAMDAEIARLVVEGKGEIEKLREQVQNIE